LIAAAALVAIAVPAAWWSIGEPYTGLRGTSSASVVDLRMVLERGDEVMRLGRHAKVGERVLFRVAAAEDGELWMWVDGPEGEARLTQQRVGPTLEDVRTHEGLVGYRFEVAGQYTFFASLIEGDCLPESCTLHAVEVK